MAHTDIKEKENKVKYIGRKAVDRLSQGRGRESWGEFRSTGSIKELLKRQHTGHLANLLYNYFLNRSERSIYFA